MSHAMLLRTFYKYTRERQPTLPGSMPLKGYTGASDLTLLRASLFRMWVGGRAWRAAHLL